MAPLSLPNAWRLLEREAEDTSSEPSRTAWWSGWTRWAAMLVAGIVGLAAGVAALVGFFAWQQRADTPAREADDVPAQR